MMRREARGGDVVPPGPGRRVSRRMAAAASPSHGRRSSRRRPCVAPVLPQLADAWSPVVTPTVAALRVETPGE